MKFTRILIASTTLLAGASVVPSLRAAPGKPGWQQQSPEQDASTSGKTVIEPGLSVGPLKLGDTEDHALQLFPKKDEDQQWGDKCGTTLDWVDAANPMGKGDLSIRINKKGKVFQIESATTRFKTSEGITTFDKPEKIQRAYKDLRAFTLLTTPSPALGDRPLVFWVDKKKGIAFALAFDPARHTRYLYKIVVFEPNKTFCPEQETTNSPKWQAIPENSVEPPADLSPEQSN